MSVLLPSPTGPGRPYPPDIIAAVRALIEHAGLSQREAAARAGLPVHTVGRWARRFGWRRASVACGADAACKAGPADGARPRHREPTGPAFGRPDDRLSEATQTTLAHARGLWIASPGQTRGPASPPRDDGRHRRTGRVARAAPAPSKPPRPYRYGPDVQAAARARVEATRDGTERIANDLGLDRTTILRWAKRGGWRRPAPPEKAGPAFYRSRRFGRGYGGDAVGTARDLVTGSNLPLDRIAARAGVSRATLYRWIALHGWTRQTSVAARRPRHHPPYGPAVVAAAHELYRTTTLSTRMIAARVGATRERVRHWAWTGGWTRPPTEPSRRHARRASTKALNAAVGWRRLG